MKEQILGKRENDVGQEMTSTDPIEVVICVVILERRLKDMGFLHVFLELHGQE